MCFEETLRVGIQCTKYCSNGKQHPTVIKLIGNEMEDKQVRNTTHENNDDLFYSTFTAIFE